MLCSSRGRERSASGFSSCFHGQRARNSVMMSGFHSKFHISGGMVMRRLAAAALVLVFTGAAVAADSPTGTWKWSIMGQGGQARETTLKLKLEGDKLTGSVAGRQGGQDTPIEDATFKDGTVSFKITRERNNMKFVTKYSGKLSGDSIKGKSESERDGQTRSTDWEAKRSKD